MHRCAIRKISDPDLFDLFAQWMAASDPWKTLGISTAACRGAFEGPCKEIFVAFYDGEPAGFAVLQLAGAFNGYIQTLFVDEPYRSQGLGRQMLEFCENRIHEGSPNVFICVSHFNTRALSLYQSLGFTLVGTLKDFLMPGYDELLLRKSIGPRIGYTPPNE